VYDKLPNRKEDQKQITKLEKEYALIGATVIDGNGGPPLNDTTIIVKDGVIQEVGNKQSVALEDNVQKVNLPGNYLMPGLIDAHVHFTGVKSCNPVDWMTEPNYLQAIRTVADAKMTPLQAITSATRLGAEACGIDNKVGTIEKGKLADLLVVKENPSVDIDVLVRKENVKYIIKEGNLAVEH